MNKWRKAIRTDVTLDDFEGCHCIYGLDLAAKTDITALVRLRSRPSTQEQDFHQCVAVSDKSKPAFLS